MTNLPDLDLQFFEIISKFTGLGVEIFDSELQMLVVCRSLPAHLSRTPHPRCISGLPIAQARSSTTFVKESLAEVGIESHKIGSQEVEYKTEEHEEVKAFRTAHNIFVENHPLDTVKHLCQINADESHLFFFDQSGSTFTLPDEPGGQAKRVRGGRMGLTITPIATPTTKGRMQIIVRSKLVGEKRFLAMQAKYSNVLKMVRNESGYQTSVSYNDFVKNSVVQLVKIVRQKHPDMSDVTAFEYQHDLASTHVKGEFRTNIEQRLEENHIVENQLPGHATWLLQVWDILIAAFKMNYEDNMREAIGLSKDLRQREDEAQRVTFEKVCEMLAKTWERFPNEWIMGAFVHRKLST